jgi:hypothetical protein
MDPNSLGWRENGPRVYPSCVPESPIFSPKIERYGQPGADNIRDGRLMKLKGLALFSVITLLTLAVKAGDGPSASDYSPVGECVSNYKAPRPTADYP